MTPTFKELTHVMIELKKQAYPSETVRINASHINRILEALERAAELEAENFGLSAGECIVEGGLVGDEGGTPFCTVRATLGTARKRIVELEDCLKPFADLSQLGEPFSFNDDTRVVYGRDGTTVTVGDFERARAALKGGDAA